MKTIPKVLFALTMAFGSLGQSCSCRPPKEIIKIDGSSTVYVITEAIAEEYQKAHHGRVSVGLSGTGGGIKKLCSKRINIIGASRAINQLEAKSCASNNIKPTEFPVALDALVIVVNKNNNWLDTIEISTLKKIFEPEAEGKILRWSDIDPHWPKETIELFAPGISSGTYDYFSETVIGREHASRGDITTSEDDNILVHGVRSNIHSLGFFSLAYYTENQQQLKALAVIDDRKNPSSPAIFPTANNVRSGAYTPLSRPIFLYANLAALSDMSLKFLRFYLEKSLILAPEVGFIALSNEDHKKNMLAIGY